MSEEFDVIIVGGGPAGLAAGLYASRMNLRAVLVEQGPPGGQLLNTELIEDYPGFESILGSELAVKMAEHARTFGLDIREFEPVRDVDVDGDHRKIVTLESGSELRAPAVILAAGGVPRKLQVPGELEFAGRGVSYCAVCDGAFFRGQELAVVGGGDAALEEGEFLTRYASKVTIVHRRDHFRAQPVLQARARANPKIEFLLNAQVTEIYGDERVSGLRYVKDGVERDLPVGGVFIFIGFLPNSQLLRPHVEHEAAGYLVTDRNMQTSIPGIWAVGDVRAQLTKQIATAVGDGTTAAVAASQYVDHLRDQERGAA
ncbi:MAG: thioredoxin-disulfide reductase [Candidatus Dormibacteraeota bacterium]|nr:thioredoxin-disulfide reductase [Candidatus Dormibacteraeota bacterium]